MPNMTGTRTLLSHIRNQNSGTDKVSVSAEELFSLFDAVISDVDCAPPTIRNALSALMEVLVQYEIIESYAMRDAMVHIVPGGGKREVYFGFRDK